MSSTLASLIGWVDATGLTLVALMVCFSFIETLVSVLECLGIYRGCGDLQDVGVDYFPSKAPICISSSCVMLLAAGKSDGVKPPASSLRQWEITSRRHCMYPWARVSMVSRRCSLSL